jgi:hypothetical protein
MGSSFCLTDASLPYYYVFQKQTQTTVMERPCCGVKFSTDLKCCAWNISRWHNGKFGMYISEEKDVLTHEKL